MGGLSWETTESEYSDSFLFYFIDGKFIHLLAISKIMGIVYLDFVNRVM